MSAALMDGPGARFSGAVNVQGVRHPIELAAALAEADGASVEEGDIGTLPHYNSDLETGEGPGYEFLLPGCTASPQSGSGVPLAGSQVSA